jgi:hypothetical protein
LGFFITFQVMTFAQVSPTDQDAVGAFGEGVDHQVGVDHARAHHPDDAAVGGILNPGDPGQVRPGIGAPVAAKSHDQRFVLIFHAVRPFLSFLQASNGQLFKEMGSLLPGSQVQLENQIKPKSPFSFFS